MNERADIAFYAAVLSGAGMIALAIASCSREAAAHDAQPTAAQPTGWAYPLSCCAGYDCREVGEGSGSRIRIRERDGYYEISSTGERILMTDAKVKPSPDGEFHWCSKGGRDDGETICLFVPPRMF